MKQIIIIPLQWHLVFMYQSFENEALKDMELSIDEFSELLHKIQNLCTPKKSARGPFFSPQFHEKP